MGHLAICNDATYQDIKNTGYISGTATLGKIQVKTFADVISSFLGIKQGDKIFTWKIHDKINKTKGIGFNAVFICDGDPIFVPGEDYPIKIPVYKSYIEYPNPVSEEEALDLFGKQLLWNAIGKKSLGRPRSITCQTPMEDKYLLKLMRLKNKIRKPNKILNGRIDYPNAQCITIDPNQTNTNFLNVTSIHFISIKSMPWKMGNDFSYEKVLEAWFVENSKKSNINGFFEALGLANHRFEWIGNYLPFGVAGSNIDLVGIMSDGKKKTVIVIELKIGTLPYQKYVDATYQVSHYQDFVAKAFGSYKIDYPSIKVVLSKRPKEKNQGTIINGTMWIGYDITIEEVTFNRII